MKSKTKLVLMLATAFMAPVVTLMIVSNSRGAAAGGAMARPEGPCDVYAAGNTPCVAAHSTTRAMFSSYNGPLYQVLRQSDNKTLDIGVVPASATDPGGYADAAAQDAFCANTYCWITTVYDQSGHKNDLTQAPPGPAGTQMATGGFNNVPVADWAPVTLNGHKVYGIFISPGMGLRNDNPHMTAVDDQAEGQYWVLNGTHYNGGCCFDYGNGETDSRDDGNGTMETTYFGNQGTWFHGPPPGPWIMTDQENNLVGCANDSPQDKLCRDIPSITWRFVTATADGEPHHWRTMGGDSQTGNMRIIFDGKRVDNSYDPMRKQGAIILGNGGDNSNGAQGTVYEAAMTLAGTMPSQETNQKLQANVVAAKYAVAQLSIAPASAVATPPGLQTFTPGASQETTVTYTNVSSAPVSGVKLSVAVPAGWTVDAAKTIADAVAPGASVSATFKITSGPASFNGDLVSKAEFSANGQTRTETAIEKVRNVSPIKINEYASSFIELYNAGDREIDISGWTMTEHANAQAIFSTIKAPAGAKIPPKGFYVLGLSNSGLAVPAKKGDATLYVRNIAGMNVGDTLEIDSGSGKETRKIANVGTAASNPTALWLPLPDGVFTIPVGSTNVPFTSAGGRGGMGGAPAPAFVEVGQKLALGYGVSYPSVSNTVEKYEVVTVTAVGKPGTQTRTSAAAKVGDTSIRASGAENISPGDKIILDIDSKEHGVETVTVKSVTLPPPPADGGGTRGPGAGRGSGPMGDATGATPQPDRSFATTASPILAMAGTTPPTTQPGRRGGMGGARGPSTIELEAPLKFNHSSNLPFSVKGTGITFQPATAYPHLSGEPIQPLGTGITLDSPLSSDHDINAVVRDEMATTAGFQGSPSQWFGGPAITDMGAMILRDAAGLVVDSLNFNRVVDPWASEGYQARSPGDGCRAPAVGGGRGGMPRGGAPGGAQPAPTAPRSVGRVTDGVDTDSNCSDFRAQESSPGRGNQ